MADEKVVSLKNCAISQKKFLILKEVSFEINKSEFVYLIGKTGSGKSSLLKTLYAELPLKEGEAKVVDFDLLRLQKKQIPFLRRKIGIVFQDFQLLTDRSVNDNLTFVMKATGWKDNQKIKNHIQSVLDSVGIGTKGFKFPHELSGGEQQRVSIARALINNPELILADEPTGNLDPETSIGIMELLIEISKKGTALLMATHDYHLMNKFPSRTFKVENQSVTEEIKITATDTVEKE